MIMISAILGWLIGNGLHLLGAPIVLIMIACFATGATVAILERRYFPFVG